MTPTPEKHSRHCFSCASMMADCANAEAEQLPAPQAEITRLREKLETARDATAADLDELAEWFKTVPEAGTWRATDMLARVYRIRAALSSIKGEATG